MNKKLKLIYRVPLAILFIASMMVGLILTIIGSKIDGIGHLFMMDWHTAKERLTQIFPDIDFRDL